MRAVVVQKKGSPVAGNIIVAADWPDPPPPPPGHAVVRTLCSALNQMDLWVGRGVPGLDLTYPRVSGCDSCGEVEEVGEGVDRAWLGRRVITNAAVPQPPRVHPDDPPGSTLAPAYRLIGEHSHGMHAERFAAPVSNLADVGPDADPPLAAGFGLCALTAWSMMVTKAGLRPGQSVLITGIGGGVATCALAIARWMGSPVAVTSRHQRKLDQARALGADLTILDAGQDWSRDVRAWTNKRGVDLVVDSVGRPTHLNCVRSLARGGAYVCPGATAGPDPATDLARLFWNQLRLLGSTMGSNDEFREVAALFRSGSLRPVIDNVFDAGDAPAAFRRLESGEQFGKIVLRW